MAYVHQVHKKLIIGSGIVFPINLCISCKPCFRLQAKAGLTGYAQVYGKYNTTPYDKLLMDLMYISHPSLLEDLLIMFATVKILFMPESTEGVEEGQITAKK